MMRQFFNLETDNRLGRNVKTWHFLNVRYKRNNLVFFNTYTVVSKYSNVLRTILGTMYLTMKQLIFWPILLNLKLIALI